MTYHTVVDMMIQLDRLKKKIKPRCKPFQCLSNKKEYVLLL